MFLDANALGPGDLGACTGSNYQIGSSNYATYHDVPNLTVMNY